MMVETGWVKILSGGDSAAIKTSLTTDNTTFTCMGTVTAKSGCWSFLKGGFSLDSPANNALIYFQVLRVWGDYCVVGIYHRSFEF